MSQPFNFNNTAITGNTTLVARYRSTGEGGAYGGNWFRVTATDGKSYVPATREQAQIFSSSIVESIKMTLIDESTGEEAQVQPNQIQSLELGMWEDDETYSGGFFRGDTFTTLKRISGYANGLIFASNVNPFYDINKSTVAVDLTGLKFDAAQFENLAKDTSLFRAYNHNTAPGAGCYGVIEPLAEPPASAQNYTFSAYGSNALNSATYTKGFGFVGQYAEAWLKSFPDLSSGSQSSNYVRRHTYLG